MQPRDGNSAKPAPTTSKWSYSEAEDDFCDLTGNELSILIGEGDTQTGASTPPGTPRRDSEILLHLGDEAVAGEIQQGYTAMLTRPVDEPGDNASEPATPKPSLLSLRPLVAPERTWHSCVADWQIMKLAQRYEFDLAYVAHMYRDDDPTLPVIKGQANHDASSKSGAGTGQLLATYGTHHLSPTLRIPTHMNLLQQKYIEYQAESAHPRQISYGQIYTFHRSFCDEANSIPPHHVAYYAKRIIDRGVILALYRMTSNGPKLCQEIADRFIEGVVDLYVDNGWKTLLLDPPPKGAEILHRTTLIGS